MREALYVLDRALCRLTVGKQQGGRQLESIERLVHIQSGSARPALI